MKIADITLNTFTDSRILDLDCHLISWGKLTCYRLGRVARCTWPIEAEAKGFYSNFMNFFLQSWPKFFYIWYKTYYGGRICAVYLAFSKALLIGVGISLSSWILSIWASFNGAPLILQSSSVILFAIFS